MAELRDVIRTAIEDYLREVDTSWAMAARTLSDDLAVCIERAVRDALDGAGVVVSSERYAALAELETEVRRLADWVSIWPLFASDGRWESNLPRIAALLSEGT